MIEENLQNQETKMQKTLSNTITTNKTKISDYHWVQDKYGNFSLEKVKKEEAKIENEMKKEKDSAENRILDNSERIRQDSFVMTEWGIGKVKKIENGIATVMIEGNPIEFPKEMLPTSLPVYLCILCKDMTYWVSLRVEFYYNIGSLKQKIAQFMKCHHSQIVIIHNGSKVDKKSLSLVEMGIYEHDVILVAIKDPQELTILRTRNAKTINKAVNSNAIKFTVPHNIIITGIGFYKNKNVDVYYDLFIYEEIGINTKLVFSEKKITIRKDEFEENEVHKHRINNIEIKANVTYQIHQYLHSNENNQYFGTKGSETIEEKCTLISFKFSSCEIPGKTNSTDVEEGMIPAIYFYVI